MLGSSVGKRGEREMTIRGRERERRCPSHGDGKGGSSITWTKATRILCRWIALSSLGLSCIANIQRHSRITRFFKHACIRTLRTFECLRHLRITRFVYIRIYSTFVHSTFIYSNIANIRMLKTLENHTTYTCIRIFKYLRHSRITRLVYIRIFNFRAFERCKHSNAWDIGTRIIHVHSTYVHSTFVHSNIASIQITRVV